MKIVTSRISIAAAILLAAGIAACDKAKVGTQGRSALAPDASAQVIGREPAPPKGDPPGTTPVAPDTTEVAKSVESNSMPLPGQPNDHSNVAPSPSQKAESQDVLKSPAAAAQANNGSQDERKTQ
jgi:hypothetical protein